MRKTVKLNSVEGCSQKVQMVNYHVRITGFHVCQIFPQGNTKTKYKFKINLKM